MTHLEDEYVPRWPQTMLDRVNGMVYPGRNIVPDAQNEIAGRLEKDYPIRPELIGWDKPKNVWTSLPLQRTFAVARVRGKGIFLAYLNQENSWCYAESLDWILDPVTHWFEVDEVYLRAYGTRIDRFGSCKKTDYSVVLEYLVYLKRLKAKRVPGKGTW